MNKSKSTSKNRKDKIKIGIIGGFPLASVNVGFMLAKYLTEIGHSATLMMRESYIKDWKQLGPNIDPHKSKIIKIIPNKPLGNKFSKHIREFFAAREFDLIISVGLGGLWWLPLLRKPYVSYATGADLTELAGGKGYSGRQVKQAQRVFKKTKLVFYSSESEHIRMIKKLDIKNKITRRQFVDTEFWKASISVKENKKSLLIFHPTSLQWISKYNGQRLKANDQLFKGFRLFLDEGGKGKLYYRKRGEDIIVTEQLIHELQLENHVFVLEDSPNREENKQVMLKMDVIADQFKEGEIGLIPLEAMALGKPVIVYYPEEAAKLMYPHPDEPPPILNASNPEEIAQQLHSLQDINKLHQISIASRRWIEKYHEPHKLAEWYWNNIINCL